MERDLEMELGLELIKEQAISYLDLGNVNISIHKSIYKPHERHTYVLLACYDDNTPIEGICIQDGCNLISREGEFLVFISTRFLILRDRLEHRFNRDKKDSMYEHCKKSIDKALDVFASNYRQYRIHRTVSIDGVYKRISLIPDCVTTYYLKLSVELNKLMDKCIRQDEINKQFMKQVCK